MVDTLLDFRAIAFLTSIPSLTTTLVSCRPILVLPSLSRSLLCTTTIPSIPLITSVKTVPHVIRKMSTSAWCLLITMYTIAVRLIAEYTPIGAYLNWQKSSEQLERHRQFRCKRERTVKRSSTGHSFARTYSPTNYRWEEQLIILHVPNIIRSFRNNHLCKMIYVKITSYFKNM